MPAQVLLLHFGIRRLRVFQELSAFNLGLHEKHQGSRASELNSWVSENVFRDTGATSLSSPAVTASFVGTLQALTWRLRQLGVLQVLGYLLILFVPAWGL